MTSPRNQHHITISIIKQPKRNRGSTLHYLVQAIARSHHIDLCWTTPQLKTFSHASRSGQSVKQAFLYKRVTFIVTKTRQERTKAATIPRYCPVSPQILFITRLFLTLGWYLVLWYASIYSFFTFSQTTTSITPTLNNKKLMYNI